MSMMHLTSRVSVLTGSKALFAKQHGFFLVLKSDIHLAIFVEIHFYVEEINSTLKEDILRQMLMRNEGIRRDWVIQLNNNLDFFSVCLLLIQHNFSGY